MPQHRFTFQKTLTGALGTPVGMYFRQVTNRDVDRRSQINGQVGVGFRSSIMKRDDFSTHGLLPPNHFAIVRDGDYPIVIALESSTQLRGLIATVRPRYLPRRRLLHRISSLLHQLRVESEGLQRDRIEQEATGLLVTPKTADFLA